MSDLIKIIIGATVVYHIVGIVILVNYEFKSKVYDDDVLYSYLNPIWLYKNYKVNYFGCLILTILFNIACPLFSIIYWLCKIIYCLCKFIKWIMTVGRK